MCDPLVCLITLVIGDRRFLGCFSLINSIFCLIEDTISTGEGKQEVKRALGRKAGAEDCGSAGQTLREVETPFATFLSHVGEDSMFWLKCRQGVNHRVYF